MIKSSCLIKLFYVGWFRKTTICRSSAKISVPAAVITAATAPAVNRYRKSVLTVGRSRRSSLPTAASIGEADCNRKMILTRFLNICSKSCGDCSSSYSCQLLRMHCTAAHYLKIVRRRICIPKLCEWQQLLQLSTGEGCTTVFNYHQLVDQDPCCNSCKFII
jgi:hypothetical protein